MSGSNGLVDQLEQAINGVLVCTGKALRAQANGARRTASLLNSSKINEIDVSFNATLDSLEYEIIRQKGVLRRDLEALRARKAAEAAAEHAAENAAGDATAAPNGLQAGYSTAPEQALGQQAPPAPMDVDGEELPAKSTIMSSDDAATKNQSAQAAQAAMAPFPNMGMDSPVVSASALPSQPPPPSLQAPAANSPIINRESPELSQSPQRPAKSTPTPPIPTTKAAMKKSVSPKLTKVPSPVVPRSTAPSATARVPSPVLVKSSPVVVNLASSQPPTPTPAAATMDSSGQAISLSSSSTASPVGTSPILTKAIAASVVGQTAATMSLAAKQAASFKTQRFAASAAAEAATKVQALTKASAAAKAKASSSQPPLAATTTAAVSSSLPGGANGNTNIAMDDFFDITGDETGNPNLGFTDMRFSVVPADGDASQAAQSQQPWQQQQQAFSPSQPSQTPQSQSQQPAPTSQPPQPSLLPPQPQPQPQPQPSVQAAQMDDSDFDVEKYAADAAQNLMLDTAFSLGSGGDGAQRAQQPVQPQPQPQPHAQGAGGAVPGSHRPDATNSGEDLFGIIDDDGDAMGEDPITNFDELYMATDSIDIDNYFDSM